VGRTRFTLRPSLDHVAVARARLRALLDSWADEDRRETAVLLLSELVTNAVRHAHGAVRVSITLAGERLRAAVRDESPDPPEPREADESGGRGMQLLQGMAQRWGVRQHRDDGKTVWFELDSRRR
jgi:anti-sigma regulatory factor (Ser/Thr protein kinase)